MSQTADVEVPVVGSPGSDGIDDAAAAAFALSGFLIMRSVLGAEELDSLRAGTAPLVAAVREALAGDGEPDPDFMYKEAPEHDARIPVGVSYIVDKSRAAQALLAHPGILRTVEKLQGADFIPTWDTMVFKQEGAGAEVAWHRDEGHPPAFAEATVPAFNVDFYLDDTDEGTQLWGVPGSNQWSDERFDEEIGRRRDVAFSTEGAVPIQMRAGDVLLHDVRALHGSPASRSRLRRVIYYEFRPVEYELRSGPHRPEYIPLKRRVLRACLDVRASMSYARDESPYDYRPVARVGTDEDVTLDSLRIPHADYLLAAP